MRSSRTYTIEQFLNSSTSTTISYESTSFLDQFSTIPLISYNIFNDYIDELNDMSVYVSLSDQEYSRYIYRPKLLAYDLYGSTELFFLILMMNNICNVKEFNFKRLKLLKTEDLEKFISSVYNSEKYRLNINRSKIENNGV